MFEPTPKDFWRAIILYGSNMSTYKMGLGHLLINYANKNLEKIPLRDLSEDFMSLYSDKVKSNKPQSRRKIINGVEKGLTYVEQEARKIQQEGKNKEKAVDSVLKNSLENMVLKKFHTLFKRQIPDPFYQLTDTHIILQKNLLELFSDKQNQVMDTEVMSRWDLLEFGFENLSGEESIEIDDNLEYVVKKSQRSQISRLRPVLNGYQDGICFYCGEELFDPIHVDHVIPHDAINHDQIWNLVLTHEQCNLWKSDHLPQKHFVQKLINRNEFVLQSDLPLKEELRKVLGTIPEQREKMVWNQYKVAKDKGLTLWEGDEAFNPAKDSLYKEMVDWKRDSFWERKFDKIQ
ncbi:HNH endonuclease protein [Marine Group I thaumarchaeote SCGC AAA799-E16]|uniref:HNH endonuclease protein n=2 Tax=Marine Group I TaxID=905826 RepID=A0A087RXU9_9ARCH|nr:HNH endonuclease protein [Marine Group I thaumarchaeote SCGC AAA799-E16]KFM18303.1 HNH endonuclease protein [Marine Group I thaumarchaeote SCGC RSA3]